MGYNKEAQKNYRLRNADRLKVNQKEANRKYRLRNLDQIKERKKAYKHNHPEQYRALLDTQAERRQNAKVLLNTIKSHYGCMNPCCKCGSVKPYCLDFHHKDPSEKAKEVAAMAGKNTKLTTILVEVRKCMVLCAICHRMVHNDDLDVSSIPLCMVTDEGEVLGGG